jgi:phenylacetate-CoA ligase
MNLTILLRTLWHLKQLRKRGHGSRGQLIRYQEEKLQQLRSYAYTNSPFYQSFHHGLFEAPLAQLPVLTKTMLMQHFDQVVTDPHLKLSEIKKFTQERKGQLTYKGEYWINATSGSTGNPGIFVFNQAEWAKVMASYSWMQEMSGQALNWWHPPRRVLVSSLKATHMSALVARTIGNLLMPMLHVDASEELPKIVQRLNAFQPDHLVGYASMLHLLAQQQQQGHLHIAPTLVFSASEVLTSDMRATIEQAFGRELFNEYAATETGSIAGECSRHTGLHLLEDHLYLEVVDQQNQPVPEGHFGDKLLVTVLFNKTQPLIRYELSDSIMLTNQICPCGRPSRLVTTIQGRTEDFLYFNTQSGNPITIHPLKIHEIMESVPVTAWQIVLEGNLLTILLTGKDPGFHADDLKTSFEAFAKREGLAAVPVIVKEVDLIPKNASGKAPLIRNLNASASN